MEIILANGQMTVTLSTKCFTNPSVLQGSWRVPLNPISKFALSRKKVKENRVFCAVVPNSLADSGKFIEKQFEFKPAFDDYLKVMESVKTGRETIPVKTSKFSENSADKGIGRVSEAFEGGEEGMESGSKGYSHRMRNRKGEGSYEKSRTRIRPMGVDNSEVSFREGNNGVRRDVSKLDVEEGFSRKDGGSIEDSSGRSKIRFRKRNDGVLKESNKFDWRGGSLKDGGGGSFGGSGRHKLEYGETNMDLSSERGLEEEKAEGSLTKTNRKWTSRVTSQFDAKHMTRKDHRFSGTYRKMNVIKRPGADEDLHEVGLDRKKNYVDLQKKKFISNEMRVTTQVRNVERANEFTRISKEALETQRSYMYGGSKVSESSLNQTLTDWEGFSRSSTEMKLGETGSSKVADVYVNNDSVNSIRVESESSYVNQINMRADGNVFDAQKFSSRRTNSYIRLDRDNTQTEATRKKVTLKSGTLTRGSKFDKDADENDMDMERAAFKSFEVFTDVRGRPRVLWMEMEERIQNLAKWLNGTDINMPEWLFSKMIHSARIKFSDHSILRVIQILGTFGNWRRVLQIIQWLQSRERFKSYKTRYIYTAALDVLGKAKRPVEALNVFNSMREGVSSYPDLAAYRCIAVTLGQAGHMKELFDVIDCMRSPPQHKFKTGLIEKRDPRLEPDIIVYNAVLNACAQRKQWEGAFWVLQQIKQQGLQPSSTTYGLIMEVMFACEKYNLVYEFFRKVEKSTIPNSLNYKVLVNTLWKDGKADDAVFAVKDMERRGIVGSASLYYGLARCLCSAGRCQEALMQMDKICKVAHKPLVVTYTGLIQACLDAGSVKDGTFIFKEMQEFCSPNLVTCNIMLKAYLENKMFEDAKDLFQKMLDGSCHITKRSDCKNTVTPDSYTFNTMLDFCAAENKWDYYTYCFQQMLHRGYNFNTKRHQRMILEACRAGKVELLETTWKHLVKANRVPPPPLVKERFCMKLEKNDYDTAISSISSHPPNELRLQAFSEKGWLDLLKANTDRFQEDTITILTHKLSTLVAGNEQPHPAIKNLLFSCREFIRTQTVAAEINEAENICLT